MVIIAEEQYNSLAHYNVKGSKWYKHKFGKYQKHAKYAMGKTYPKVMAEKQATINPNDPVSQKAVKLTFKNPDGKKDRRSIYKFCRYRQRVLI